MSGVIARMGMQGFYDSFFQWGQKNGYNNSPSASLIPTPSSSATPSAMPSWTPSASASASPSPTSQYYYNDPWATSYTHPSHIPSASPVNNWTPSPTTYAPEPVIQTPPSSTRAETPSPSTVRLGTPSGDRKSVV